MAIKSGFFHSIGGDRKYNADDIGRYLMGIVSSGVYADESTSLQVLANDGMAVEVQPGRAMLHYHYMENDSPLTLTLDNGGTRDRIDAIVALLDLNNRICDIVVKKGTEAAEPSAPAMLRTDTIKEYMLASVYITKLATSITQSNITDTRADKTVCGWVTGVIEQVDTSTLFVQWQAAYEEAYAELGDYLEAQKVAWNVFFQNVQNNIVVPVPNIESIGKAVVVNENGDGYTFGEAQTTIPVTSEVPDDSDIWIDPDDDTIEENHLTNRNNPHGVTCAQIGAVPTARTVNGKPLTGNIVLTADDIGMTGNEGLTAHTSNKSNPHGVTCSQIGAVPTTRTINGKALSSNVTLTADNVGARANTWTPSASDVGALPTSGGTVSGKLTLNGLVVLGSSSYGTSLPSAGTKGRLFFKKV